MVVWDRGSARQGKPIREFLARHPRLELFKFPTYSPALNPVEQLWSRLKHVRFCNYAPDDPQTLDVEVRRHLHRLKRNQPRLKSLLEVSDLKFDTG